MNSHYPNEESAWSALRQNHSPHRPPGEVAREQPRSLRTGPDFYRQVVESQEDYAVFTTDRAGIIDSWNAGAAHLLGYTAAEIIGQPAAVLFTGQDQPAGTLGQALQQTAQGEPVRQEWACGRKDGSAFRALCKLFPLLDEQARPVGFAITLRDLDELKQAQADLARSLDREKTTRERAERQQQDVQLLFSQVPAILSVLRGPELRYELVNKPMAQMAGERECLGKTLPEAFPGIDPGLLEIYREVYRTGERFVAQAYPIDMYWEGKRSQVRKYFDLVYEPFRNEQGQVDGVISFGYDVTPQVLARQQAEEGTLRVQQVLEGIPAIAWTTTPEGTTAYYNARWYAYCGIAPGEGLNALRYIHPEDQPRVAKGWQEAHGTQQSWEAEYRLRRADGAYRWHLGRVAPLFDQEGVLLKWIGTATDIDEQKRATQQLHAILEIMPQIVWTGQPNGDVNYYNQRWYDYTGMNPEQTRGWGWQPVLHPEDVQPCINQWSHSVRTGEPYQIEYRFRQAATGQYRWHLGRAEAIRNGAGEIILWAGTATDIHEQKLLQQRQRMLNETLAALNEELAVANEEIRASHEEILSSNEELAEANGKLSRLNAEYQQANLELIRINKDLDNFVYIASHDLRAPVANLDGLQRVLSKRLAEQLDAEEHQIMRFMQDAINRLSRTIKDLSDVARVQKDTDQAVERVSLRELLREASENLAPLMREADARVEVNLEVEFLTYPPHHLRSILYNLLSNALKYRSPERSPTVGITTRRTDGGVLLTVTDNGLGLTGEQTGKLFRMFKRLHAHVEGTGIGLYMVRRLVENYGGSISVESVIGVGTTFRVWFKQADG